MEMWFLFFLSLALAALLGRVLPRFLNHGGKNKRLPPGPPAVPIIGNLLWLRRSISELEDVLREIHGRYGPIVTLHIGARPVIFIADRAIAHTALVAHGAIFSDRPAPHPATRIFVTSERVISAAAYGPLWRLLRRNLTAEILHSTRIKHFADGRSWVLGILVGYLRTQANANAGVTVVESFQFAMFCLLVLMCFGEKLDENAVRDIEDAQRSFLLYGRKLNVLAFAPRISKYLFRNRVKTAMSMRQKQKSLYLPLIEARKEFKKRQQQQMSTANNEEERFVYSYLDSLLNIELPEEGGRNLSDDEIVSLCSEFLNGGTDTTSTALQWIMAELVRHPHIQSKLREEIQGVAGDEEEIKEEELHRMPYLKAVVMEGLRRHPPGHFVLPHAVTEDVSLCGYLIPKEASINFLVAKMNLDGKAWEEPTEFKPERFLGEGAVVDITGSREIKMMPFGAGRRICPGLGLAMLHLEYFVANLVRAFMWEAVDGEEVDMAEKTEFTVVMKNPLRARLTPSVRARSTRFGPSPGAGPSPHRKLKSVLDLACGTRSATERSADEALDEVDATASSPNSSAARGSSGGGSGLRHWK